MQTQDDVSLFSDLDTIAALDQGEIEHELINLRDQDSLTNWRLGRVINLMYAKCKRARVLRTKEECCVYVARFIDNRGRGVDSMLLYSRVAAAFPPQQSGKTVQTIEDIYPLPFSHFQTAMRYGDRRFDVLKISLEQMEKRNGRPIAASQLERHLEAAGITFEPQEYGEILLEWDGSGTEGEDNEGGEWEGDTSARVPQAAPILADSKDMQKLKRLLRDIRSNADGLNEMSGKLRAQFPYWGKETASLVRRIDHLINEIDEAEAVVKSHK